MKSTPVTPTLNPWAAAVENIKAEKAKPPEGCQTIEEIALQLGVEETQARTLIKELIAAKRAETVRGKCIDSRGRLVPAIYFRLIP